MRILDEDQQRSFLLMLHRLTREGKLVWERTGSPYRFKTTSGRFGFTIASRDDDDFAPFDVRIFDLKDSKSENVRPFDTFGTDEFYDLNEEFQQMYTLVKRKLMGLDSVVSDLFGELEELDGN